MPTPSPRPGAPAGSSWSWCRRARWPSGFGRAQGIPAFYTPTGVGTNLAQGKPMAVFDGRPCLQERWLKPDVALRKAELADPHGNLTDRLGARHFNPLMPIAAALTIVQARWIVPLGGIDLEAVVTPGIFVQRVVEGSRSQQEEDLFRPGARYP